MEILGVWFIKYSNVHAINFIKTPTNLIYSTPGAHPKRTTMFHRLMTASAIMPASCSRDCQSQAIIRVQNNVKRKSELPFVIIWFTSDLESGISHQLQSGGSTKFCYSILALLSGLVEDYQKSLVMIQLLHFINNFLKISIKFFN